MTCLSNDSHTKAIDYLQEINRRNDYFKAMPFLTQLTLDDKKCSTQTYRLRQARYRVEYRRLSMTNCRLVRLKVPISMFLATLWNDMRAHRERLQPSSPTICHRSDSFEPRTEVRYKVHDEFCSCSTVGVECNVNTEPCCQEPHCVEFRNRSVTGRTI